MEKQKEFQQDQLNWLTYVKEITASKQQGQLKFHDALGLPVILEWNITDIKSPELADFKKNICEIALQAVVPAEMEFLHRYPESVNQELFLKSCAPFFENGLEAVDWKMVENTIQSTIKQFYLADLSKFGDEMIRPLLDDIYFLVTIKNDKTEKPLGFAMFSITPMLGFGNIKVITIGVINSEQNRQLDKLLMSSIFKIVSNIERLFIFLRPTHDQVIERYVSWGFVQDKNPIQDPNHKANLEYSVPFEYKAEQKETLQEIAKTMIRI